MKRDYKKKRKLINKTGYTPGYDTEKNPVNYIPSEDITMANTPYPVYATPLDQNGNPMGNGMVMQPGGEYKFKGASYVEEIPFFQAGGRNKIAPSLERQLLKKYVDPVTERAMARAKQQGIRTGIHNGGLDAIRHSSSAAATSSILPSWANTTPVGLSANIAMTNLAGLAHEVNSPNSFKEHASDLYNNFVGSVVGTLPITEESKHNLLIEAQKNGILSDMGNKRPLNNKQTIPSNSKQNNMDNTTNSAFNRNIRGKRNFNQFLLGDTPEFRKGGQKSDWISDKISTLVKEGYPQKQAIAIAYSMYENKHGNGGYQLPMYQSAGMFGNNKFGQKNKFAPNPSIASPEQFSEQMKKTAQINPTDYGLGVDPNKPNPLSEESLTAGQDFAKRAEDYTNSKGVQLPQNFDKNIFGEEGSNEKEKSDTAPLDVKGEQPFQFFNPYSGVDIPTAASTLGSSIESGDTLGTIGSGLKLATGLARNFFGGMGQERRKNFVQKQQAEKQREGMTGAGMEKELRFGGYYQNGGEEDLSVVDYGNEDMVNKYPNRNVNYSSNQADYAGASEQSQNSDMLETEQENTPNYDKNSARDTWVAKTGMPWSEAKKLGYTSGSAKDNMKLLSELNDPRFKKEYLRKSSPQGDKTYNGGQLKEVVVTRPKKNNYVDPYKGWYNDSEGDLRNAKGVMVGLDGKPLNFLERNFGSSITLPPLDENGKRMKPLRLMPTVEESNAYHLAQGKNKIRRQKELENVWGKLPSNTPFIQYQQGGTQPGMEEGLEGQSSNPQEEGMEQQGSGQEQQIMQEVSQALQQGSDPQQIVQQLVQMGVPQEQAVKMVQAVMQQMQSSTPQLKRGGAMCYQDGGEQQMIQQVSQALQQGAQPQQVMKMLLESGMSQDQAIQLVQAVMQQIQQQGHNPQEEAAEGGQENPQEEAMEQGTPQMKRGGSNYQEGGEMMDEQIEGENEGAEGETPSMEQIEDQVEQALKQGADPQQVLQQLVQMGMPKEQALQMIQELLQEIQAGETGMEAPEEGTPQMSKGGRYMRTLVGKTIKSYTYNPKTDSYTVSYE